MIQRRLILRDWAKVIAGRDMSGAAFALFQYLALGVLFFWLSFTTYLPAATYLRLLLLHIQFWLF